MMKIALKTRGRCVMSKFRSVVGGVVVIGILATSVPAPAVVVGDLTGPGGLRIGGVQGPFACEALSYNTGLELSSGDCDIEVNTYSCYWMPVCEGCQTMECRCTALVTAAGPDCEGVNSGFHL